MMEQYITLKIKEHWFSIKDIHESIGLISDFVGTMSFDEFMEDSKTRSAVAYQLQIIEGLRRIYPGKRGKNIQKYPGALWQECVIRLRIFILASIMRSSGMW